MSDNDGFSGIARAAVNGAKNALATAEPEQLELVALMPPSRLGPELAALSRVEVAEAARVRGIGRPKGAGNLATRQVKEFLVKMFGDPAIESARWLLHTPASLSRELGCTVLEAWDRQQRIREALLPYIHAKLAPLDGNGQAIPPVFQLIMGGAGAEQATLAPWQLDPEVRRALEHEIEQNQGLSNGEPAIVAREESHD